MKIIKIAYSLYSIRKIFKKPLQITPESLKKNISGVIKKL